MHISMRNPAHCHSIPKRNLLTYPRLCLLSADVYFCLEAEGQVLHGAAANIIRDHMVPA